MNTEFMSKKPSCFGEFNLIPKDGNSKDDQFIYRYVICHCDNHLLNIYACKNESELLAPILLECPECGHRELVFDPEIHGWDGQNGDNCSMVGESEPELINDWPLKVETYFSFQGLENYSDLAEDGVTNLEDYFDTFGMYGLDTSGKIATSIDYECA
jgi:hypothetical protein